MTFLRETIAARVIVSTGVSASTFALGTADVYVATAQGITFTVSSADITDGRVFTFKDESAGGAGGGVIAVTVDTQGSETIDGLATVSVTAPGGQVTLFAQGGNLFSIPESTSSPLRPGLALPENVRCVFTMEDFPAPVAGVIPLAAGVQYTICAPLVTALRFEQAPGGSNCFFSTNLFTNTVTYTGAGTLFTSNGPGDVLFLTSVQFFATDSASTFIDMTYGAGMVNAFVWDFVGIVGFGTVGSIDGYTQAQTYSTVIRGFDVGLTLEGGPVRLNQDVYVSSGAGSGPALTITGAGTTSASIAGFLFVLTGAGESAIEIDAGIDVDADISVADVSAVVPTAPLFSAGGIDQQDRRVNALNNGANADSVSTGGYTTNSNAVATTIASANVYQAIDVTGAVLTSNASRFALTDALDGVVQYNGLNPFVGAIGVQIAASKSGATQQYRFLVTVNGAIAVPLAVPFGRLDIRSTVDSVTLSFPVTLQPTDTFQVLILADGHTDTLTIVDASVAARAG